MKHGYLKAACLLVLTITSCKKEEGQTPSKPHPVQTAPQFLLKKIEYKSGINGWLTYNTDSSIKTIIYENGSAGQETFFDYQDKKLVKTGYVGSLHTTLYTYDNNNRVIKMHIKQVETIPGTSYSLEYTYNSKGQVAEQKFYVINEAGTKHRGTSTYQYNAQNLITRVVTLDGQHKYTWDIEAYSDEYSVSPWVFVNTYLSEFYAIYNYPVISSMNRLPAKLRRTAQLNGGTPKVDRIDQQKYEITGKKINKLIAIVDFPGHPELHATDTAFFKY
ncbi:hypothetical protein [uncultured Chitinophaga sp.]|uniref:hypothetical protein n=1 Tax=uncultured Chitinophaga sp. TaxID=339340 RepID=UPI0025F5CB9A|nr:hypothetical protein [uncultured Chitinophaga sp.]